MAQLGIEPRSLALCRESAGYYIASIIPLDHCAVSCVTKPRHQIILSLVTYPAYTACDGVMQPDWSMEQNAGGYNSMNNDWN